VVLVGAAPVRAQEVIVSAAVRTKDAVEELGRCLAAARPGLILRCNTGASGELQK
jgi:phosphohistidine phosphatase SixA